MQSPSSAPLGHVDARSLVRVSSMQVRGLLEGVEQAGVSEATFLARTRLKVGRVASSDEWFDLHEFDALMVAAMHLSDDPCFGLHWGERSLMMQVDLVPSLMAAAPTLRQAFDGFIGFQPMLATRPELQLSVHGDRGVLTCSPLAVSDRGRRIRSELWVSGLARFFAYTGDHAAIRQIDLAHALPQSCASEYQRLFGTLVRFEQPQTRVVFAASALDRKHANRNPELYQALRERAERLRHRALGQLSYAEQLEQHIRAALPRALRVSDAAQLLGISERSLRRRLAEEDLSYSNLVDHVQYAVAIELLRDRRKTMKEVAYAVGFHSASGLHRAFRRWTGGTLSSTRLGLRAARGAADDAEHAALSTGRRASLLA